MKINVQLFAAVRDVVGCDSVPLEVTGAARVADLRSTLIREFPRLQVWEPYLRVAVNCEFASHDQRIEPGSEVAIIPPVSGG